MRRSHFHILWLAAAVLLAPTLQTGAIALGPCGGPVPFCDGACPPLEACIDVLGTCECVPTGGPCGVMAGPPLCYGDCPPFAPHCVDTGGPCMCVVPTLSEWGIIGMSLVMFGGVLYMRRRRDEDA